MTPRFSLTPPWARYVLVATTLVSLTLSGLILHERGTQHQLAEETTEAQQTLQTQQQALGKLREAQQKILRQQQKQQTTAQALVLLENIGRVLHPGVALRTADVNPSSHNIRLEVSAKSLAALLEFSQALQKLPAKVVLENHRDTAEKSPEWPVTAVLDVSFQEGRDEAIR